MRDKSLEIFLVSTVEFIAMVWRFMLPGKVMPCCLDVRAWLKVNPRALGRGAL